MITSIEDDDSTAPSECCDDDAIEKAGVNTAKFNDKITEKTNSDDLTENNERTALKQTSHLQERFEELKKRRLQIAYESKKSVGVRDAKKFKRRLKDGDSSKADERKANKKRTEESCNGCFHNLNTFMPDAFEIKDRDEAFKKTKLEGELDEAISDKEFELAEQLSNEITKRKFATQVKNALDAQKHTRMKAERERTKKKKRRKLKWAFDHKERWETKGNM